MKTSGNFTLMTLDEFKQWLFIQKCARKILLIQNHHTYLPDYKSWNKRPDALFWMRSMERSHTERGFSEIAQQFTTFPDGTICLGRSMNTVPAGIKGANINGICIEHFGNFDVDGDAMSEAHKKTIVEINADLLKHFKLEVNTNSVVYHHWYNLTTGKRWIDNMGEPAPYGQTKSCPGTNFFYGNNQLTARQYFYPLIQAAL